MPRISAIRGERAGPVDERLEGKTLDLEVWLLRLIDSGRNSAVAALTKLAKADLPE
jgi:hypothetical protein